jgi:hypothetical protein
MFSYSSLIGIPIAGISKINSTYLILESSYFEQKHPNPSIVALAFSGVFSSFSRELSLATGPQGHPGDSQRTELFISDPDSAFSNPNGNAELFKMSPDLMSERLEQLLNTYYIASMSTTGILGGDITNSVNSTVPPETLSTFATTTTIVSIYVCHWGWLATFALAILTMLITAVTGVIFKHRVVGPDILGYVSTLTLDNPHIIFPSGGTTLGGMDRARLLKDVGVTMGDICGLDEVGRIALTSPGESVVGLSSERYYV